MLTFGSSELPVRAIDHLDALMLTWLRNAEELTDRSGNEDLVARISRERSKEPKERCRDAEVH